MRTDLYHFDDSGVISTFTSGNRKVSFDGNDYIPSPIRRGDILVTTALAKATLEVTMSLKNQIAKGWLISPAIFSVLLTVYTKTDNDEPVVAWRGRIVSRKASRQEIIFSVDSTFTVLQRRALRKRFQRSCPYSLYGKGCGLDRADFSTNITIGSKAGLVVVAVGASGQSDGVYAGGMLEDSEGVLHFITTHIGNNITLQKDAVILTGVDGIIYPGCRRNITDCADRFDNLLNYGGFPYIPLKNPLGGGSIA